MVVVPKGETGPVQYGELMWRVRKRFEVIRQFQQIGRTDLPVAESIGFQLRKIIEAIAFGCLVAVKNGLNTLPREVRGQWNAATLLKGLEKKGVLAFPSPSIIRPATPLERDTAGVASTIEGQPERRLTVDDLVAMYENTHPWLHERNPFIWGDRDLTDDVVKLQSDVDRVWRFIDRHMISIAGQAFFCVLIDSVDKQTKVLPLAKAAA